MAKKVKFKLPDFKCNLLLNGINEFRNMLLDQNLPTEDIVDHMSNNGELLRKCKSHYNLRQEEKRMEETHYLPLLKLN